MAKKLMRTTWYPQPHSEEYSWQHKLESGIDNEATMLPMCMYDEGLGAPSARKTNPENASFAEVAYPNCYPKSRIDAIFSTVRFTITEAALNTDNLHAIRCAFMITSFAFKKDYTAIDELSSTETQDVLNMQTESTDRQGYPNYNGVKVGAKWTGSNTLHANIPGLTTNQIMEAVSFNPDLLFDAHHYMMIKEKLRKLHTKLFFFTLTRTRPTRSFGLRVRSNAKRMNEYASQCLMTYVPKSGTSRQLTVIGDTTTIAHVYVDFFNRFNEWNENFNFAEQ